MLLLISDCALRRCCRNDYHEGNTDSEAAIYAVVMKFLLAGVY